MKHFIYISKTKIDMLYPQISRSFLSKFKGELKFNAGVVSGSLGTETENAKDYYDKINAIEAYISENDVGNIASPKSFIKDTAILRYGGVQEYVSKIAVFGNQAENKKIALFGSMSSLIGSVESAEANHAPYYYTLKFIEEAVEKDAALTDDLPYMDRLETAVDIALSAMPKNDQQLSFLARVLHSSDDLLVATPIYIAIGE